MTFKIKTSYVLTILFISVLVTLIMMYITWKSRKQLQQYTSYVKQCNMQQTLPFHIREMEKTNPLQTYPAYPAFAPQVPNPYHTHNFRESFAPINEVIEPIGVEAVDNEYEYYHQNAQNNQQNYLRSTNDGMEQYNSSMIFSNSPDSDYEQMTLDNQSFKGMMMSSQIPKTLYSSSAINL